MSKIGTHEFGECGPNELLTRLVSLYKNSVVYDKGEPVAFNYLKPRFIQGLTGVGKSSIVKQFTAALANCNQYAKPVEHDGYFLFDPNYVEGPEAHRSPTAWGLIDLRIAYLEPSDLRGMALPDTRTSLTRWFPPEDLPLVSQAHRFPKYGVLLLDEISNADPTLQNACYQLMLDRRVGQHRLLPGWLILSAGNKPSENSLAHTLSNALNNRLAHDNVIPTYRDFADWAYLVPNFARTLITFLQYNPSHLHRDNRGQDRAFPTPRSWADVSDLLNALPDSVKQDSNALTVMVAAHVGQASAIAYTTFLTLYESLFNSKYADLEGILKGKVRPEPFIRAVLLNSKETHESVAAMAFASRVASYIADSTEQDLADRVQQVYRLIIGYDTVFTQGRKLEVKQNGSIFANYGEVSRALFSEITHIVRSAPAFRHLTSQEVDIQYISKLMTAQYSPGISYVAALTAVWESTGTK